MLDIWFAEFADMSSSTFQKVIKGYCKNNHFAPNSPYDLLAYYPNQYSVDEAWNIVFDALKNNTSQVFVMKELEKHPIIYNMFKKYRDVKVEEDSFGNKTYNYSIGRLFKRDYKNMLGLYEMDSQCKISMNQVLIG